MHHGSDSQVYSHNEYSAKRARHTVHPRNHSPLSADRLWRWFGEWSEATPTVEDVALVVLFQATNSDVETGGTAGQCLGAHNGATTEESGGSGPHPPQICTDHLNFFDEECDYRYVTDCSARNWVYHPYFVLYNNLDQGIGPPTLKTWLHPWGPGTVMEPGCT